MSIGYYIGLGDKTECGGEVIEGDSTISWDGLIHSLEGHLATCGKDLKSYPIRGGVSSVTNNGRRVAGTLDSFSGCPCGARLLPSVTTASYEGEVSPSLPSQHPRNWRHSPPLVRPAMNAFTSSTVSASPLARCNTPCYRAISASLSAAWMAKAKPPARTTQAVTP